MNHHFLFGGGIFTYHSQEVMGGKFLASFYGIALLTLFFLEFCKDQSLKEQRRKHSWRWEWDSP
jgi:hypothetical protein